MTDEKINEDVSFEELLKESTTLKTGWLEPGQRMEARIVDITTDWIFLDLGAKSEGYLDKKELLDEEGNCTVEIGDTITAYFLFSRHNEMLFTTRITSSEAGRNFLEHAWRGEIPVDGLVEKEIKGGFQIKIAGDTQAFCPFSLMGLRRVEDTSEYLGQRLSFLIAEYSEEGRNIILSRRAILEAELRAKIDALKEELKEGMKITGTVASIQKFGAFLDIGGIQGLLPISEIGWGRVDDVKDVLSIGQELEVMILKLDWENDRISFSIKAMLPDPWEKVEAKYPAGSSHIGKVARLAKFGAFVTLEGGIDGLIHISKLGAGKRINHPGEVLEQGQSLEVTVESVDLEKKRLSLKLAQEEKGADQRETADGDDYKAYLGTTTPASMGTFGDILKEKLAQAAEKKKKKKAKK
jgi:small subunit ribosomal protein S1